MANGMAGSPVWVVGYINMVMEDISWNDGEASEKWDEDEPVGEAQKFARAIVGFSPVELPRQRQQLTSIQTQQPSTPNEPNLNTKLQQHK